MMRKSLEIWSKTKSKILQAGVVNRRFGVLLAVSRGRSQISHRRSHISRSAANDKKKISNRKQQTSSQVTQPDAPLKEGSANDGKRLLVLNVLSPAFFDVRRIQGGVEGEKPPSFAGQEAGG